MMKSCILCLKKMQTEIGNSTDTDQTASLGADC